LPGSRQTISGHDLPATHVQHNSSTLTAMHGAADRLIHRGLSLTEYTARSNAEEQYDEEVPVHSGLFIM
jgi:hypothetical protein